MGTFNKGRMVLLFLVVFSAILLFVSTATDYWSQSKRDNAVHQGLWKGCIKVGNQRKCLQPPDKFTQDWKRATRALMLIADASYFFIFCYAIIMHIKSGLTSIPIGILLLITFLFSMIALSVYTVQSGITRVSGLEFGFSYIVGWCGCALTFLAAIVTFWESSYSRGQSYRQSINGNPALLRG